VADKYNPDAILADPTSHPTHKMYAEINIRIRDRGERWSKCANCGDPYRLTPEWDAQDICSDRCFKDYMRYLTEGG
jgi:hypothetical protein